MSAKLHVLSKRTKIMLICNAAEPKTMCYGGLQDLHRYIVRRDRRRSGEDLLEMPDIFLIPTRASQSSRVGRGEKMRRVPLLDLALDTVHP